MKRDIGEVSGAGGAVIIMIYIIIEILSNTLIEYVVNSWIKSLLRLEIIKLIY